MVKIVSLLLIDATNTDVLLLNLLKYNKLYMSF